MKKEELQELLNIMMVAYKRSAFELEETPIVLKVVNRLNQEIKLFEKLETSEEEKEE